MQKKRLLATAIIAIGLIVPIVIDRYETANHLDISRDVGALPWLILTVIGVVLFALSFIQKT